MFAMFELGHTFNMKIEKAPDDQPPGYCLSVNFREGMYKRMEEWFKIYEQIQSRLEAALSEEEREVILKEYRMWQWSCPKALTDRTDKAMQKARIQEQIDKLQQLKDEIDSL